MLYLDNAATTFPKPISVINAVNDCMRKYCGNPGRASHKLSVKTAEEIYRAREVIAELLNYDKPENVVFTQNATYALNIAIKTSIPDGAHVLISHMEHNSVIRPLEKMRISKNVSYSVFKADENLRDNIEKLITPKTKAIISTFASNVNGASVNIDAISKICKEHSLIFITDASQWIGHHSIDLKKTPCNVLCAPAHKALFGLQGAGFAVFCDDVIRESFIEGGSGGNSMNPLMSDYLPERYEAGTLPTPSIVALRAGIEYIQDIGVDQIGAYLEEMTEELKDRLSRYKEIDFLSGASGVVSFNLAKIPSYTVAELLDKNGICVRSGYHCAPIMHKALGTDSSGTVRISFSCLNKKRDIDYLERQLSNIMRIYY